MPRTSRASAADFCYHVLNRGNAGADVFFDDEDYSGFVELLELACERLPMRVLAYCLLPDHFHLVLQPHHDGDLSRWMQWVLTAHVRRYHRRYGTSGHVWQGRFRAFPCQEDDHLLTCLRFVESNPVRSGLVDRAEDWPWSGLSRGRETSRFPVETGPRPPRRTWVNQVNRPLPEDDVASLRRCIARGAPFGDEAWARSSAKTLGILSSLNPRGRPKKVVDGS